MKRIVQIFLSWFSIFLLLSSMEAATRITVTRSLSMFSHSAALTEATRALLGGVLLHGQASFVDTSGNKIPPSKVGLGSYDPNTMVHLEAQIWFKMKPIIAKHLPSINNGTSFL